jgi:hypothetical protein
MSTMHPLDVVELRAESGRWPAGTTGTILEVRDDTTLVEIADDRGHMLDLLTVPAAALAVPAPVGDAGR